MRHLLLLPLVCLGLALVAIPAHTQEPLDGGLMAVVNGDVIFYSQVRELVGPREKEARATLKGQELVEKIKELRAAAVRELIDRTLILQEAKDHGFVAPEATVDERIDSIVDRQFGGDKPAFRRSLEADGYTLSKFSELQRNEIVIEELRKQVRERATSDSEAKQKEDAWLQKLYKKAYIKIY
jgi:hypothetical protein